MTNNFRKPRTFSVPARLLSVIGLALVASLLIWHTQAAALLGFKSGEDAAPVIVFGPSGSSPPAHKSTPGKKPSAPSEEPKTSSSPKATKSTGAGEKTQYSEESIDGLSSKLRTRLKKAMSAAEADGVPIRINSGRRSAAKQRRLLQEAIEKYGSYEAATRWVLPPEKSAHVTGKAVDIGPQAAMTWLDENGWKYGICRRYDNEPWHFEALTTPGTECPPRESNAVG
jgi:hypothetical protein